MHSDIIYKNSQLQTNKKRLHLWTKLAHPSHRYVWFIHSLIIGWCFLVSSDISIHFDMLRVAWFTKVTRWVLLTKYLKHMKNKCLENRCAPENTNFFVVWPLSNTLHKDIFYSFCKFFAYLMPRGCLRTKDMYRITSHKWPA